MRTLLSQFCEEFDSILRALIHPAHETAAALSAASDELSCKSLRPPLVDLALQLESLADKVAEQQAYVLIFGPLKSGKSTLMNALAGTYVSEVSSLPAYPCMVYVAHAPEREYTVTRYSGATQIYSDPEDLHLAIHRATASSPSACAKPAALTRRRTSPKRSAASTLSCPPASWRNRAPSWSTRRASTAG